MLEFTINVAPVTKKNSSQIVTNKATGRPFVIPSAKYKAYEKYAAPYIPKTYITGAINVKALYYMPTHRRVDLINLHSALHDVLVKCGCIVDDNSNVIVSTDGSRVLYDKENPRTEVVITEAVNVL
jgi:Holliday junction resolvase RusA-like endonuclease